ncbi:MAG: type II secretion system F family protein [Candidatus Liptonbacteria bacterium]|nr:type II secretion system F family protein [Candidatus Liptonbacteria bacterium]
MLYHYLASDKSGKVIEADFDADNLNQVLQHLSGRELRPVSVTAVKKTSAGRSLFSGKITVTDKVFLTKYLALMLRVGTDLLSAINILLADFDKPAMRNFLLEVRDNLSRGQPFYKTFEMHKDVFPATFISLVKAAEASGNLQATFEQLSGDLLREAELRSRIRSALIYPIILLSAALAIIVFLVTFALPRIAKVFNDSGIDPPFFSKIVFTVGLFLGENIAVILPLFLGLVFFLLFMYFKTQIGKSIAQRAFSRMPVIRDIYVQLAVQRLASTMSSLMRAGLPIIETINVAAETVNLPEFKFSLERIANEGLAKGLTIGEAFKRETVYPKVVTNLIAISEKAGHLEEVLATLADFYAANVDAAIKSLVSLLEPVLLLMMGAMVAMIALSIIVPIYQLTTQF